MKKRKKRDESRSHNFGLTNNPARLEAARKAFIRQKEAALKAGFKLVDLPKHKALDDYFQFVQHNAPEVISIIKNEARKDGFCQWCEKLQEAGLGHCLHCGAMFENPPSP